MAGENGGRNGTAFNAEDAENAEGSGGKKVQNAECGVNDGPGVVPALRPGGDYAVASKTAGKPWTWNCRRAAGKIAEPGCR